MLISLSMPITYTILHRLLLSVKENLISGHIICFLCNCTSCILTQYKRQYCFHLQVFSSIITPSEILFLKNNWNILSLVTSNVVSEKCIVSSIWPREISLCLLILVYLLSVYICLGSVYKLHIILDSCMFLNEFTKLEKEKNTTL